MNAEQERLAENKTDERWHLWGPYLAERAWGTVREDEGIFEFRLPICDF